MLQSWGWIQGSRVNEIGQRSSRAGAVPAHAKKQIALAGKHTDYGFELGVLVCVGKLRLGTANSVCADLGLEGRCGHVHKDDPSILKVI